MATFRMGHLQMRVEITLSNELEVAICTLVEFWFKPILRIIIKKQILTYLILI